VSCLLISPIPDLSIFRDNCKGELDVTVSRSAGRYVTDRDDDLALASSL
jgi:hypothetical protein